MSTRCTAPSCRHCLAAGTVRPTRTRNTPLPSTVRVGPPLTCSAVSVGDSHQSRKAAPAPAPPSPTAARPRRTGSAHTSQQSRERSRLAPRKPTCRIQPARERERLGRPAPRSSRRRRVGSSALSLWRARACPEVPRASPVAPLAPPPATAGRSRWSCRSWTGAGRDRRPCGGGRRAPATVTPGAAELLRRVSSIAAGCCLWISRWTSWPCPRRAATVLLSSRIVGPKTLDRPHLLLVGEQV
jgi:hypothetical protein